MGFSLCQAGTGEPVVPPPPITRRVASPESDHPEDDVILATRGAQLLAQALEARAPVVPSPAVGPLEAPGGGGDDGDGADDDDDDDDDDDVPISLALSREASREAHRLFSQNVATGGAGEPIHAAERAVTEHAPGSEAAFDALALTRVSPPIAEVTAPRGPIHSSEGGVEQVGPSQRGALGPEGGESDFGPRHRIREAYGDSESEASSAGSRHAGEEVSQKGGASAESSSSESVPGSSGSPPPGSGARADEGKTHGSTSIFHNIGGDIQPTPRLAPVVDMGEFVPVINPMHPVVRSLFQDDFSELGAAVNVEEEVEDLRRALVPQDQRAASPYVPVQVESTGDHAGQGESRTREVGQTSRPIASTERESASSQPKPAPQTSSSYSDSECVVMERTSLADDTALFRGYEVHRDYVPLLTLIDRHHPETFIGFTGRSVYGGGLFVNNLCHVVGSVQSVSLKRFDAAVYDSARGAIADFEAMGFRLDWLSAHLGEVFALRKGLKLPHKIRKKEQEVEKARTEVELVRTALAQREAVLRERQGELDRLIQENASVTIAGVPPAASRDLVGKGLFPQPQNQPQVPDPPLD